MLLQRFHKTADVGNLDTGLRQQAITAARRKAERLSQNDTIIGAFIAQDNAFVITEGLRPYVSAMNPET